MSKSGVQSQPLKTIKDFEQKFRAVSRSVNYGIITANSNGNILDWNPGTSLIFGYTESEIIGKSLTRLMPERFHKEHTAGLKRVVSGGSPKLSGKVVELVGLRKNGEEFPLEISFSPWHTGDNIFFTAIIRDITERQMDAAKIDRVTRFYIALSQCNEAIVRSTGKEELFPKICCDAVTFGGIKMAWIGMVDESTNIVNVVASCGNPPEFSKQMQISVDSNDPMGQNHVSLAIRENKPYWCQDFQNDETTTLWHDMAKKAGFKSFASLPLSLKNKPVGILTIYSDTLNAFDDDVRRLLIEMTMNISFALDNFAHHEKRKEAENEVNGYVKQLENAFMHTVGVVNTLSEMRDPYTTGHERRVADLAVAIGKEMGFDERRLEGLKIAGWLHDLGKITIPAEILAMPRRLTATEYALIKEHSQTGFNILKQVEFPWPVGNIILQHHERIDGSGYPNGLKGEEILLESRIMAVADVVEAMASHRPYRPALEIEKALLEIKKGSGIIYDKDVVQACLRIFNEHMFVFPEN